MGHQDGKQCRLDFHSGDTSSNLVGDPHFSNDAGCPFVGRL